jgi:hypothetical protein
MYEKNNRCFSSFNSPTPSSVKAEKVVNPPHKPVIRNSFQVSAVAKDLNVNPQKIPISRHPVMFTAKVPQGKEEG